MLIVPRNSLLDLSSVTVHLANSLDIPDINTIWIKHSAIVGYGYVFSKTRCSTLFYAGICDNHPQPWHFIINGMKMILIISVNSVYFDRTHITHLESSVLPIFTVTSGNTWVYFIIVDSFSSRLNQCFPCFNRTYLTIFISVNFNMKCFKMKIVSYIQSCIDKQKLHSISNSVLNHLLLHLQRK